MAAPYYTGQTYGQEPQYAQAAPPASETDEQWAARVKQKAREEGWSEDFERYSPAVMATWRKFWDESKGRFRSQHAPEGAGDWAYVEKPTESVIDPSTGDEFGPWGNKIGVNLSSIPVSQGGKGPESGGGGGGAPGAGGAAGGLEPSYKTTIPGLGGYSLSSGGSDNMSPEQTRLADLQRLLEEKFINREGVFGKGTDGVDQKAQSLQGGGLWWGGTDLYDTQPKAPAAAPNPKPRAAQGNRVDLVAATRRMEPAPGSTPASPTLADGNPVSAQPQASPAPSMPLMYDTLARKRRPKVEMPAYAGGGMMTGGGAYA